MTIPKMLFMKVIPTFELQRRFCPKLFPQMKKDIFDLPRMGKNKSRAVRAEMSMMSVINNQLSFKIMRLKAVSLQ